MNKQELFEAFKRWAASAIAFGANVDDLAAVCLGYVIAVAIKRGVTVEDFLRMARETFIDVEKEQ
jgi:hypothetical protein